MLLFLSCCICTQKHRTCTWQFSDFGLSSLLCFPFAFNLRLKAPKCLDQSIIPGQEFQGYDSAIVRAVLGKKRQAGEETQSGLD